MLPALPEHSKTVWLDIVTEFEDGVLVCDSVGLELAHWSITTAALISQHKVVNVHHIDDQSVSYEAASLFLIIGEFSTLDNMTKVIERWIESTTQFVTVISLLSFNSLKIVCKRDNPDYYYLDTLYQLNDTYLSIIFNFSVMSLPAFSLTPHTFITPSSNKLFPLLPHDLDAIETWLRSRGDNRSPKGHVLDLTMLPNTLQLHIKVLAEELGALFDELGVVEDCYSVGNGLSRLIASQLVNTAANRPARNKQVSPANKLDIIFVDRTLDLFNVTSFNHSTSAGKLVLDNSTQLFEGSNDVIIDLRTLFNKQHDEEYVINGSLADSKLAITMKTLLTTDHIALTKHILDGLEGQLQLDPDTLTSKDLSVILPETDTFSKYTHFPLFNVLSAMHNCNQQPWQEAHTSLANLDTSMFWTTLEESVLISKLVNSVLSTSSDSLSPSHLITFLLHLISLFGEKSICGSDIDDIEQAKLKNCLYQMLKTAPEDTISRSQMSVCKTDEDIHCKTDEIMRKVESVAGERRGMQQLDSLIDQQSGTPVYKPLVKQILDLCLESSEDLMDIEYRSGGLRDLLKTGLGLFTRGAVRKPRPSGNVLVYVVGGISAEEVRLIENYRTPDTNTNVFLAGNCLLNHDKLNMKLLSSDNVFSL